MRGVTLNPGSHQLLSLLVLFNYDIFILSYMLRVNRRTCQEFCQKFLLCIVLLFL